MINKNLKFKNYKIKNLNIIILAAGQGVRLAQYSKGKPKAMVEINGLPLIEYSVRLAEQLGVKPIVVVGYKKEQIKKYLGNRVIFVEQKKQLGTGHAVKSASKLLKGKNAITLVYFSDMPLWSIKTAKRSIKIYINKKATIVITSAKIDDSFMFGRTVRDKSNKVIKIIEVKDCTLEQLKIQEMHASFYAFDNKWLFNNLFKIKSQNVQGEYYLTDTVALAINQKKRVEGIWSYKPEEAYGVNTVFDLRKVEKIQKSKFKNQNDK